MAGTDSPKSSVYQGIWRSIAVMVIAVFVLAGAVISYYVVRTNTEQIEAREKAYLADVDAMLEHQLTSTRQIMSMLMSNSFVVQSVYTGNEKWNSEVYWSGQIVVNAVSSSQMYNSIYVISGDQIAIKSSRRYQSPEDEARLIQYMQQDARKTLIPWRSVMGGRESNNLMLLSALDTMNTPNSTGGVLINIDLNRLAEAAFVHHGDRQIYMALDGMIIASSEKNAFFTEQADHAVLGGVSAGVNGARGSQYVFSRENSTYGYTLYSVQARSTLLGPAVKGWTLLLVAIGGLLTVALRLSRRAALHAYVPVKTILIELEENLPAGEKDRQETMNDVQRATHSIRAAREIVSAYQKNADTARLRKYILNGDSDPAVDAMLENGLDCRAEDRLYLLLFKADAPEDVHMAADVLQGALSSDAKVLTLDMPDACLLSLIHLSSAQGNPYGLIRQNVQQVLRLMESQGAGKVIVVMKEIQDSVDALPNACAQMTERMRSSVFCSASTLLEDAQSDAAFPSDTVQRACRAALQPDEGEFLAEMNAFLAACRLIPAREAYHQLATLCMRISEAASHHNQNITDRLDSYRTVQHTLFALRDYEALMDYMKNLHRGAQASIISRKTGESNPLAEQIVRYVKAHFQDPSLSAAQVAEEMGVSVSHLSRVINKSLGCAFPELLQKIRLEYAEEQLSQNANLSISDLAQKCGFSSSSYFSANFKKMYGTTPSNYFRYKHPNEET